MPIWQRQVPEASWSWRYANTTRRVSKRWLIAHWHILLQSTTRLEFFSDYPISSFGPSSCRFTSNATFPKSCNTAPIRCCKSKVVQFLGQSKNVAHHLNIATAAFSIPEVYPFLHSCPGSRLSQDLTREYELGPIFDTNARGHLFRTVPYWAIALLWRAVGSFSRPTLPKPHQFIQTSIWVGRFFV